MFYESRYPKNELKNISKELWEFSKRFLLHENRLYKLEKSCFIWFYFIRKLIESKYKITDRSKKLEINVKSYKFIWKKRLRQPIWGYDEYDYEKPTKEKMNIKNLTNQFVHSQLFFGVKEWKWLKYIYISSDYTLYNKIYEIDIKDIIIVFNTISKDFVTSITNTYKKNKDKVFTTCC